MLQILFLPALHCAASGSIMLRAARNKAFRSVEVRRPAVARAFLAHRLHQLAEPTFGAAMDGERALGGPYSRFSGRPGGRDGERKRAPARHAARGRLLQNVTETFN